MYTLSRDADVSSNNPKVLELNGGVEQKMITKPGLLGVFRA
jgi:hypothetical protein